MNSSQIQAVRVIRHVRIVKNDEWGDTEISSQGGFTFVFSINYVSRIVNVYFSTCSTKENFCKFDGIRYAEELGVERSIDLDQFQKFANNDNVRGFVSAYISIIRATRTLDGNSHREDELLKKLDKVTTYLNLKA